MRNEEIDDTYIIYLQNSTKRELEVTIKFTLLNMSISIDNPSTVRIPALTEKYLCILRKDFPKNRKNHASTYSYKVKYSYKIMR